MATVIDALVVTLGLDASGYTKGQKDAAGAITKTREATVSAAKDMEARGKQAAEFFSRLRREAVGLYAAFTGAQALRNFGKDAAAADASVGRLANNLGIAAEKLSAYQGAAERVGGTKGGLDASLQAINDQIQNFRLFGQQLSPVFQALGVQLADPITGAVRSVEDIYADTLDALHKRAPEERASIAASLGLDQGSINLAGLDRGERERLLAEQRRLGTVTKEQADAAASLQKAWLDLSQAFETGWRQVRTELTPAINALLRSLTDFAVWLSGPDLKPAIAQFGESLKWLADYLGSNDFKDDMRSFGRGIHDLGVAILNVLRWLGIVPASTTPGAETPALPGTMGERLPPALGGSGAGTSDEELRRNREQWGNRPGWGDWFRQNVLPQALGGYGAGASPSALTDNHRAAQQRIERAGYTAEQAAGLVANLHQESGVNPQIRAGDNGRSHGILQWNSDRLRRFQERNGGQMPEQTSLQTQLDYMLWELSEEGPEAASGRAIRAARTARDAGRIASRQFVRPGVTEEARAREEQMRGDTANNFLPALTARPPQAGTATAPPPATVDPGLIPGAGASLINNTTNQYAGATSTSSAETNIGTVTIQTQATDAAGIVRDFRGAMQRYSFVEQASRGMV